MDLSGETRVDKVDPPSSCLSHKRKHESTHKPGETAYALQGPEEQVFDNKKQESSLLTPEQLVSTPSKFGVTYKHKKFRKVQDMADPNTTNTTKSGIVDSSTTTTLSTTKEVKRDRLVKDVICSAIRDILCKDDRKSASDARSSQDRPILRSILHPERLGKNLNMLQTEESKTNEVLQPCTEESNGSPGGNPQERYPPLNTYSSKLRTTDVHNGKPDCMRPKHTGKYSSGLNIRTLTFNEYLDRVIKFEVEMVDKLLLENGTECKEDYDYLKPWEKDLHFTHEKQLPAVYSDKPNPSGLCRQNPQDANHVNKNKTGFTITGNNRPHQAHILHKTTNDSVGHAQSVKVMDKVREGTNSANGFSDEEYNRRKNYPPNGRNGGQTLNRHQTVVELLDDIVSKTVSQWDQQPRQGTVRSSYTPSPQGKCDTFRMETSQPVQTSLTAVTRQHRDNHVPDKAELTGQPYRKAGNINMRDKKDLGPVTFIQNRPHQPSPYITDDSDNSQSSADSPSDHNMRSHAVTRQYAYANGADEPEDLSLRGLGSKLSSQSSLSRHSIQQPAKPYFLQQSQTISPLTMHPIGDNHTLEYRVHPVQYKEKFHVNHSQNLHMGSAKKANGEVKDIFSGHLRTQSQNGAPQLPVYNTHAQNAPPLIPLDYTLFKKLISKRNAPTSDM